MKFFLDASNPDDGIDLIRHIVTTFKKYECKTPVLAGAHRPGQVRKDRARIFQETPVVG